MTDNFVQIVEIVPIQDQRLQMVKTTERLDQVLKPSFVETTITDIQRLNTDLLA